MDDLSKRNLVNAMNDCFDRAEVCDADSEDYLKLLDKASKMASILNDQEQMEMNLELERQKQLFEEEKMQRSEWFDRLKLILTVGVPVGLELFRMYYERQTLILHTKAICDFERTNTFTSYAGKGLVGSLRLPQIMKSKRG